MMKLWYKVILSVCLVNVVGVEAMNYLANEKYYNDLGITKDPGGNDTKARIAIIKKAFNKQLLRYSEGKPEYDSEKVRLATAAREALLMLLEPKVIDKGPTEEEIVRQQAPELRRKAQALLREGDALADINEAVSKYQEIDQIFFVGAADKAATIDYGFDLVGTAYRKIIEKYWTQRSRLEDVLNKSRLYKSWVQDVVKRYSTLSAQKDLSLINIIDEDGRYNALNAFRQYQELPAFFNQYIANSEGELAREVPQGDAKLQAEALEVRAKAIGLLLEEIRDEYAKDPAAINLGSVYQNLFAVQSILDKTSDADFKNIMPVLRNGLYVGYVVKLARMYADKGQVEKAKMILNRTDFFKIDKRSLVGAQADKFAQALADIEAAADKFAGIRQQVIAAVDNVRKALPSGKIKNIEEKFDVLDNLLRQIKKEDLPKVLDSGLAFSVLLHCINVGIAYQDNKEYEKAYKIFTETMARARQLNFSQQANLISVIEDQLKALEEAQKRVSLPEEPLKPLKPIDVTQPINPVEPVNPVDSREPVKPAEPSKLTPEKPLDPKLSAMLHELLMNINVAPSEQAGRDSFIKLERALDALPAKDLGKAFPENNFLYITNAMGYAESIARSGNVEVAKKMLDRVTSLIGALDPMMRESLYRSNKKEMDKVIAIEKQGGTQASENPKPKPGDSSALRDAFQNLANALNGVQVNL